MAHPPNGCEVSVFEWRSRERDLHAHSSRGRVEGRRGLAPAQGAVWIETGLEGVVFEVERET